MAGSPERNRMPSVRTLSGLALVLTMYRITSAERTWASSGYRPRTHFKPDRPIPEVPIRIVGSGHGSAGAWFIDIFLSHLGSIWPKPASSRFLSKDPVHFELKFSSEKRNHYDVWVCQLILRDAIFGLPNTIFLPRQGISCKEIINVDTINIHAHG